jgi:hypothetical protein
MIWLFLIGLTPPVPDAGGRCRWNFSSPAQGRGLWLRTERTAVPIIALGLDLTVLLTAVAKAGLDRRCRLPAAAQERYLKLSRQPGDRSG